MTTAPFPVPRSAWRTYGNYKRLCCGMIYVHPVRPWWWTLELYTILVMCVFAAEYDKFQVWQTCIGLGLGGICLVTSFKTMLSDPGICPRPPYDEAVTNYNNIHNNPATYRRKLVEGLNGKVVEFSYCYRCNTYRPPSAGHCGVCDACIRGWDHHCPVFGGCVGYKNKYWFFWMAFSVPLFWVFMLALSGITVFTDENPRTSWYDNLTLCFCIGAFLGAIIVPPLMSCCCRCLDRAHTNPGATRSTAGWSSTSVQSSYPRQPSSDSDEKYVQSSNSKRQINEGRTNNNPTPTDVEIKFLTY